MAGKHESFPVAHRAAERDDDRRKKSIRKSTQTALRVPSSIDDLLLLNARDHLTARGCDFAMITMPVRTDGDIHLRMRTIESALHR